MFAISSDSSSISCSFMRENTSAARSAPSETSSTAALRRPLMFAGSGAAVERFAGTGELPGGGL